jgi:hypothetical protein
LDDEVVVVALTVVEKCRNFNLTNPRAEVAVSMVRAYVVPGLAVVVADLKLILASPNPFLHSQQTLASACSFSSFWVIFIGMFFVNSLDNSGRRSYNFRTKWSAASSPVHWKVTLSKPDTLNTGSDRHATVLGAALGLPAGCNLLNFEVDGLGVGVDHGGDLRLLVLGLEAQVGAFPSLSGFGTDTRMGLNAAG